MTDAAEISDNKLEEIVKTTKKNFDPRERLRKRGLRRATITLFLDEEVGEQLGRDYPRMNSLGIVVGHDRVGIIGDLAELAEVREKLVAAHERDLAAATTASAKAKLKKDHEEALGDIDSNIAELEAKRDELIKQLIDSGLTLKLRAVPPVIQKDCHRKAKQTCEIEGKGVPEDRREEVNDAEMAHLVAAVVESMTDNETGDTNNVFDYSDAVALAEELPPSQWARLDAKIGELQFTDGISRAIESQEDFS